MTNYLFKNNPLLAAKSQDFASPGGVSNTPPVSVINSNYFCNFDWFSITSDCFIYEDNYVDKFVEEEEEKINKIINLIVPGTNFNDYESVKSGKNGYAKKINLYENDIELYLFGPQCVNGGYSTMLNCTGVGSAYLTQNNLWFPLFLLYLDFWTTCTRIDFALNDCCGKHFTIYDLLNAIEKKHYTSIWKGKPFITGTPIGNGEYDGLTIYFGQSSETSMRVYDKLIEIKDRNTEHLTSLDYWVRWEMTFRGDKAEAIIKEYVASKLNYDNEAFLSYCLSVLSSLIQIRVPKKNKQKCMWRLNEKWQEFLHYSISASWQKYNSKKPTLDKKIDWFNRSCMRAVSQIYLVYGEEIFMQWLKRGMGIVMNDYEDCDYQVINNKLCTFEMVDKFTGEFKEFTEFDVKTIANDLIEKNADLNGVLKSFERRKE